MTGQMVKLPEDEDTPEKVCSFTEILQAGQTYAASCSSVSVSIARWDPADILSFHRPYYGASVSTQRVDKIFRMMDRDKNAQRKYATTKLFNDAANLVQGKSC